MVNTYIQHRRRLYGPRPFVAPPVIIPPPPPSAVFQDVTSALYDFTNPVYRTDSFGFNAFGAHEAFPRYTPTSFDWYWGVRDLVQSIPSGGGFAAPWFELVNSTLLSPTYDVRFQAKDFLYQTMAADHSWGTVFSSSLIGSNGGYWNGAFGGGGAGGVGGATGGELAGFSQYGGVRDESANGGGQSVTATPLGSLANCDFVHGWSNNGYLPFTSKLASFFSFKARLLHDVNSSVDLSTARLYVSTGIDTHLSDGTFAGGPSQTRMRKISYKGDPTSSFDGWQAFSCFLLTNLGVADLGIPSSPTSQQLCDGMRAMIVSHPPVFQSYP